MTEVVSRSGFVYRYQYGVNETMIPQNQILDILDAIETLEAEELPYGTTSD